MDFEGQKQVYLGQNTQIMKEKNWCKSYCTLGHDNDYYVIIVIYKYYGAERSPEWITQEV